MKSVYDASTGIEAHMIKNLLQLNDVKGEVLGEHLQGGVGDLQAIGTVRVVVDDDDFREAKRIISEWEASQPPSDAKAYQATGKHGSFGNLFLGFLAGAVAILLVTQTNIDQAGIDYDGDGEFEEKFEYVNNTLRAIKIDQNRDGEIDAIYRYNLQGELKAFEHDSNFDGRYEGKCRYVEGLLTQCRTDEDGDGFNEYRERYSRGVLATRSIYDPVSRKLKKKQHFDTQRLTRAEIDLDADGQLETHYEYDIFEELIR